MIINLTENAKQHSDFSISLYDNMTYNMTYLYVCLEDNTSDLPDRQEYTDIVYISSSTLWKLHTLRSSSVSEEPKLSFQGREKWEKQSEHLEWCKRI